VEPLLDCQLNVIVHKLLLVLCFDPFFKIHFFFRILFFWCMRATWVHAFWCAFDYSHCSCSWLTVIR